MRYPILVLCLLLVQPSLRCTQSPDLRTWTSSDGNYAVRAELVEVDGSIVRLRKPDGSIVTVPLAKLSAADREFLASPSPKKTPPAADSAAEKAARAALEKLGMRVGGSGLVLVDESKLSRMLRDVADLRKNVIAADTALVQQEKNDADIKRQLTALLALNVNLNAQLANLRPGDTTTNNRLVGTINANHSQIELLRNSLKQQAETIKTARTAANEAREAFMQAILNMRTLG